MKTAKQAVIGAIPDAELSGRREVKSVVDAGRRLGAISGVAEMIE